MTNNIQKWEYFDKAIENNVSTELEAFGLQGWELVSCSIVVMDGRYIHYLIFKRPIKEDENI